MVPPEIIMLCSSVCRASCTVKLGNEPFLFINSFQLVIMKATTRSKLKNDFVEKIEERGRVILPVPLRSTYFAQGIVADLESRGTNVIAGQDVFKLTIHQLS